VVYLRKRQDRYTRRQSRGRMNTRNHEA
jgi:hypothetical protein